MAERQRVLAAAAVLGSHFGFDLGTRIDSSRGRSSVTIGDHVTLLSTELRCHERGSIDIGHHVWMSLRGQIIASRRVSIGSYCILARDVYISDTNEHPLTAPLRRAQTVALLEHGIAPDRYVSDSAPVRIGDDVWIGERSMILKGVTLGDRCVVAGNAVVTKSFPADSLVAGNPATLIRRLG